MKSNQAPNETEVTSKVIQIHRNMFRVGTKCWAYGIIIRLGKRYRVWGKEL